MSADSTLISFLERNRIEANTWEAAKIEWSILQEIGSDHDAALTLLSESAELFARLIQRFDKVHSVRWRVKKTEHLLEKIVRKRAEGVEKYLQINRSNYFEVVTDLVGIRALHLYKEDCIPIDASIREAWKLVEAPVAYVREGDPAATSHQLSELGFDVKNHPAGYRSIHYIVESHPVSRKIITEIQVRTIFEEGWSEIDHNIRYPNLSDSPLVEYFLTIFNRMAGSADEMGAFVRGLTRTLREMEDNIVTANAEKEKSVQQMEAALTELENANTKDKASTHNIQTLKAEVAKLRAEASAATRPPSLSSKSDGPGLVRSSNLGFSSGSAIPTLTGRGVRNLTNAPYVGLLDTISTSDAIRKALDTTGASETLRKALLDTTGASETLRKALDTSSASETLRKALDPKRSN